MAVSDVKRNHVEQKKKMVLYLGHIYRSCTERTDMNHQGRSSRYSTYPLNMVMIPADGSFAASWLLTKTKERTNDV